MFKIFGASVRDGACGKLLSFFYIEDVASSVKGNADFRKFGGSENTLNLTIFPIPVTEVPGQSPNV